MSLFSKKGTRETAAEYKEFFTPTSFSLKKTVEEIEHNIRTYYPAATEQDLSFLSNQVKKVYPFIKYFTANRNQRTQINLFDHTVRTVLFFLKDYSSHTSLRIHQAGGINYAKGETYKWEEAFNATLLAIYHDTGKIFSQNLSFKGEDGFAYRYNHSFFVPPDAYFQEIENENGVKFVSFDVEGGLTSTFKISHPLLSAAFFARRITEEEYEYLRNNFFFVLFFLNKHHSLDISTLDNPAIKTFLDADRKAASTEVKEKRKALTEDTLHEIFDEMRSRILSISQFWNKQSGGVFTLRDYILLTSDFINNFDKEKLGEFEEVSILGILKFLGIDYSAFPKAKIINTKGEEIADISNGGILIPEGALFTEQEIATKIKKRYIFRNY